MNSAREMTAKALGPVMGATLLRLLLEFGDIFQWSVQREVPLLLRRRRCARETKP